MRSIYPPLRLIVEIEFDPAKDAANREKHGIALDRAIEMEDVVFVEDGRFAERRLRLYGLIDGRPIARRP